MESKIYKVSYLNTKFKLSNISIKNVKDLLSGIVVKVILLLTQLLIVPLFLNSIGTKAYGEWLIITTVPNYLTISDLGLTVTITNEICRQITLKNYKKATKLFRSANTIIIIIGFLLLFTFLLLSINIDFSKALSLSVFSEKTTETMLILFIVNLIISFLLNFNLGCFKAANKYHLNQSYTSILYFLDFLAGSTILLLKANICLIPLLLSINRILILIISYISLSKYEWYDYGFSLKLSDTIKLIPSSIQYTIYNLGFAILLQGNTFIVGKILGSSEVVVFNTVRTMVNSVKSFLSVIYLPSLPKFTILLTVEEKTKAWNSYKKLMFIAGLISIIAVIIIYLIRDDIFKFWLNTDLKVNNLFMILMLTSVVIQILWNTASMIPISINKTKGLLIFPLLSSIAIVIQGYYLSLYGLNTTAITQIVIDLIMLLMVNIQVLKILK